MKQTNYYLFDFLDFDPGLNKNESLWKAYKPKSVIEKDGDIIITIPFQKEILANEMIADNNVKMTEAILILRRYSHNIIRMFISWKGEEINDNSPMISWSKEIRKIPLSVIMSNNGWNIFDEDNNLCAFIHTAEPKLDYWSELIPKPQPTFDMDLYPDKNKVIKLSAYDHFSPTRYDALPLAYCVKDGQLDRATISFECEPNECFAGTGERFYKMDLSGHTFQLKNQDGQGVNNRRAYKNIPFYLSSRMYGVFFHTSAYCKLSLADHSTRSVQFLNEEPKLDVFIIGGTKPENILHGYRSITGFPSMPPLWSFGIWMSRMTYFSANEVNDICERLRKEHYPCDVIHLDTGWFKTDWLCEWKFNPERFPNPKKFIHDLRKEGFKVSLWQLPYVAENAEQIDEAKNNGYISKLHNYQRSEGSNFSALDYAGTIDFTYPKAVEWYQGLLKNLLDMGVTCIKADFGENIHMDADYYGMKPELLNNIYSLLYQKTVYDITKKITGDGIIWARAAWAGCQRYPLHWGGDSASTWDGMAGSLKGGIHFGLSGFAFWSHDIPGFHSLPNFMNSPVRDDIYMRWTQFGVFTSHMRYHGTCKREPWHHPKIAAMVKKWWKLRYELIPYIWQQSSKSISTGYSLLRGLVFDNFDDYLCWHIDDEYYFGDDFLVAPVMNSENIRDIYLPKGKWVHFFTGKLEEGEKWLTKVKVPLEEMLVYVKWGSEIPIYKSEVRSTDDIDMNKIEILKIDKNFKGYWNK